MEESAHLIKHSLRAATATMSSSSPEGWSPKLRAVVLGPTPPDAELVWTTWKPDGSPWFEHRCELSELADEETYEAELQHLEDGTDIDDDGDCRFTLRLVMELDGLDELLHDGVVQVRRIGAADDHVFAAGHDWLLSLGLVALDVDDEADAPMLRVTVFLGGDADAFDCEAHCFKDGKRFAKASDISGGYTFTTNDDTVVGVEVIASFEEIRGWNNLTDEGWGESSWHLLDGESGKYEIKFLRSGTVTRIVSFDVVDGRITSADRIEPDASLRPTMWLPAQIEGELDGPHDKKAAKANRAYGDMKTAAIDWTVADAYRLRQGAAAAGGAELDDATAEALQLFVDRADTLVSTWEQILADGPEAAASEFEFQLQCEAIDDQVTELERRRGTVELDDDQAIEVLGEPSTIGAALARVQSMRTTAAAYLGDAEQAAEDALAPYREVLHDDKLAVFEDHPAPDYLYYTTNKKVIETPAELAKATFWYFEGRNELKATAEIDGKKVKGTVEGWRVLGWKFDADHNTVDEFESQGEGSNAPKSAFKH